LATVAVDAAHREQVRAQVEAFGGEVLDVGDGELTVMLAERPETVDEFERLLADYRIVELQRTGRVALPKLGPSGAA
jgi:acetolactate synthase-1/3 small subunit